MRKRVVVTGLGCVSPVGNNVKDTWSALLAGKSGAAPIAAFDASAHKTRFAAEVKGFDAAGLFGTRDARKMDRFTQFATAATLEAMQHANFKIDESNCDRVGILIGTGIGGIITLLEQYDVLRERGPERVSPFLIPMMISDSAAGNIAIRVGARARSGRRGRWRRREFQRQRQGRPRKGPRKIHRRRKATANRRRDSSSPRERLPGSTTRQPPEGKRRGSGTSLPRCRSRNGERRWRERHPLRNAPSRRPKS